MENISPAEAGIIKNMLLKNSYKQIAELLSKPVNDIKEFASTIGIIAEGVITKEMLINRKPKVVRVKKISAKKFAADIERAKRAEQRKKNAQNKSARLLQHEKNKLHERRMYKTRQIDYSTKATVRIDAKTIIYCEPGQQEEARKKYLAFYKPI